LIKEFAKTIGKSIAMEEEIINSFALETKIKFIKNIINAVLGETKGVALFQNMVEPYLFTGEESFRDSYNYDIDFVDLQGDIKIYDKNEILFQKDT